MLTMSMDTSFRKKINKVTEVLNDTIDQLALIHIYRTLHPKNQHIHLLFSSAQGAFYRIYHILGEKKTKQASINLRGQKYQISFPTIEYEIRNQLQKENWEENKPGIS